jgi:hypothetical protein
MHTPLLCPSVAVSQPYQKATETSDLSPYLPDLAELGRFAALAFLKFRIGVNPKYQPSTTDHRD